MILPTVPEPVEGMRLTPADVAAWAELKRGLLQAVSGIDKFLSAYTIPKETRKERERMPE
jgi:urease accessory protein UreF